MDYRIQWRKGLYCAAHINLVGIEKIKEQTPVPFQLRRPIYVVCNDTLVENPIISSYVDEVLEQIQKAAREQDLPIFVRKTIPRLEDSFWVNVIGKGYPVPNTAFRWCTEKMKIKPTARFITEQVDECGEAIVLIGTVRLKVQLGLALSKNMKSMGRDLRIIHC